jgi:hypothetical protein
MGHRSRRGVPSINGDSQKPVCHVKSCREPFPTAERHPNLSGGGRTWWAHFEFTRINTTPTILPKKIEDVRKAGATLLNAAALGDRRRRRHRIHAICDCLECFDGSHPNICAISTSSRSFNRRLASACDWRGITAMVKMLRRSPPVTGR